MGLGEAIGRSSLPVAPVGSDGTSETTIDGWCLCSVVVLMSDDEYFVVSEYPPEDVLLRIAYGQP